MKRKYIESRFPEYFVFGEHKDGRVDIATPDNDAVATVSKAHALNLINDRKAMLDMLVKVAVELDEVDPNAFSKIWYE